MNKSTLMILAYVLIGAGAKDMIDQVIGNKIGGIGGFSLSTTYLLAGGAALYFSR
jgi:hypothetical protein